MNEDQEPVSEIVARQQNQPGQRVKDFMLRIRSERLTGGEVAVPVRKLTMLRDVAEDLLGRVVVARHVAHVELVDAGQYIGETDRRDQKEKAERQQIAAPADRYRRLVTHGSRL